MATLTSIPTRRLVAGLVAGVALSNGAGIAAAATPRAARADVRHLLAPVHRLNRAINARHAQLDQLTSTWSATGKPCVDSAYAGIDRQATGGDRRLLYNLFTGVVLWDAGQQWTPPLEHRLATIQQSYATMRVQNRRLRAAARGKARQIAAWRAAQPGDLCDFVDRWAGTGYDPVSAVTLDPGYAGFIQTVGGRTGRAVDRGARRLHHLGASADDVEAFDLLPLLPLGQGGIDLVRFP
jgi:hypothetical protein